MLIGSTTPELEAVAVAAGAEKYRGRQIARWIYQRRAASIEEMTDLPAALVRRLNESYQVGLPRSVAAEASSDGTVKHLFELADGSRVESVLLPYADHVSACLSTQVGCPAGCTFCATAQGGLLRNLTPGEIAGQLLAMQRQCDRRISHAVYMGMGEPLFNYDNVVKSLRILGGEMGLSMRNLTVSTVGVVPGILALADEGLPITLALSLHAPDDELRQTLIPTARKWKLEEILTACERYAATTSRNLTFEYLLLGGVNDSPEHARALARLLDTHRLPGNVNLIPFNYVETPEGFKRPTRSAIAQFRDEVERSGRVCTQRMTRGEQIAAACGQLRRRVETLTAIPLLAEQAPAG